MNPNELISKLQSLIFIFRKKQTERILAALAVGLFGLGSFLFQQSNEAIWILYLALALFAAGATCLTTLLIRLWKQALPAPPPSDVPMPSAVKGLLPFTVEDGRLFARLGRKMELQQMLALAQNDQVGISVIRGQSGAGKTSLLRAGLEYSLGEVRCIYWEAMHKGTCDALLHVLRSHFPNLASLEDLPDACSQKCLLVLDQFEQLHARHAEHAPVFALLTRIALSAPPHQLSALVSFRREYAPDWLDFEQAKNFRAEQLALNLLAPPTAGNALATLASEAGFTLDQDLVENFIRAVRQPEGVSPVDVAIGVLSLANFVQERGINHINMTDYTLAGGAEGLLLEFVQQKLEEIPAHMRSPLLKGIVLGLVDLTKNQRIASGATAATLAQKAEVPESSLFPCLERLAHPRVRLLDKLSATHYRLPHDRLVPIMRRLTGKTLASLDQLRMFFENGFARWQESHHRKDLLGGKVLRQVLQHKSQWIEGDDGLLKEEYLKACFRHRNLLRLGACGLLAAFLAGGLLNHHERNRAVQRQKLISQGLQGTLLEAQEKISALTLPSVYDISWLNSDKLEELDLSLSGEKLTGLQGLKNLTQLHLKQFGSRFCDLAELKNLEKLKRLRLELRLFRNDEITSLSEVAQLSGLQSLKLPVELSLDLSHSKIKTLKGLAPLTIPDLSLNLANTSITSLSDLQELTALSKLTLLLGKSQITSLKELGPLENLADLTLDIGNTPIASLSELKTLKKLSALELRPGNAPLQSLKDLEPLDRLDNLHLNLSQSPWVRLPDISALKHLRSLTLTLGRSQIHQITGLEQLHQLKTLTLDLRDAQVHSLGELAQLKSLEQVKLRMDSMNAVLLTEIDKLRPTRFYEISLKQCNSADLSALSSLKALTSLDLGRTHSQITHFTVLNELSALKHFAVDVLQAQVPILTELEQLKTLESLEITLPASMAPKLPGLKLSLKKTRIKLVSPRKGSLEVPGGLPFVALQIAK